MNKQESGIIQLVVMVILLAGLAVGVYLVKNYTNILPKASEPAMVYPSLQPLMPPSGGSSENQSQVPVVNSKADLDQTLNNLNTQDLNSMEKDLGQNDSDSQSF